MLFLLSEDELRHVLTDSGAVLVVTTPEFLPKVDGSSSRPARGPRHRGGGEPAGPGAGSEAAAAAFAELEAAPSRRELIDCDPAGAGRPAVHRRHDRPVQGRDDQPQRAVRGRLGGHGDVVRRPAQRTALLPLPLSHVYGLMVSVMSLHSPGPGTSVLMRWFDPAGWLELAQQHRVNVSPLVPSMLQMLLQQPLEDYDLSALARLTSGSAPLPRAGRRGLPQAAAAGRDRRGLRLHRDRGHHLDVPARPGPAGQRGQASARRRGPDRAAGRERGRSRRRRRDLRARDRC